MITAEVEALSYISARLLVNFVMSSLRARGQCEVRYIHVMLDLVVCFHAPKAQRDCGTVVQFYQHSICSFLHFGVVLR